MENRKYKVCRDNIYVGEVIRTSCVYQRDVIGDKKDKMDRLDVYGWRSYRSILFTLTEDNLADDLLYDSPNYPILNISGDENCMYFDDRITLVKDAYNLSELLRYFGYNEELTYEDIIKIRKKFFSGNFVYDNCKLFGYKESKPEDWTYYKNGIEITDSKKIKKCILHYKRQRLLGHKCFSSIDECKLPREYWDIISERRDSTLIEFLTYDDVKLDSFAPYKREGKIKRLRR